MGGMDAALQRRLDGIIALTTLIVAIAVTLTLITFGTGVFLLIAVAWLVIGSVVSFLIQPNSWYSLGQKTKRLGE